jgi:hypothetical protein
MLFVSHFQCEHLVTADHVLHGSKDVVHECFYYGFVARD